VELLTGLLFYACAAVWSFTPPTFVYSLFLALLVILVFVDYQHQILPNVVTIPGTVAGILLSPFQAEGAYRDVLTVASASALQPDGYENLLPWIGSTLGALIGGGILLVVGSAYRLVRKRHGLGMGDVKMMAMVGAFLGWRSALLTIFAASLAGSIIGLFLILFQGKSLQHKLAFGTFLGIGAAAVLFFGASILGWYTSSH
jgi:leader peptidase (prepilin peptidase)/N-methyltransferase